MINWTNSFPVFNQSLFFSFLFDPELVEWQLKIVHLGVEREEIQFGSDRVGKSVGKSSASRTVI